MDGGQNLADSPVSRDILLTGHEDGSVKFWDSSTTSLKFLYKLSTGNILQTEMDGNEGNEEEEEWPPFRKVNQRLKKRRKDLGEKIDICLIVWY